MAEQTLNIPQLVAILLIGFVVFKYFYPSSSSSSNANDARPQDSRNGTGRRADPRQVEQLAQMFPQVGRREIQWDLQRNGGSMAATTERILSGRGLEVPPPSFQPQPPPQSASSQVPTPPKSTQPDLITRYNLADKLKGDYSTSTSTDAGTTKVWAQSKSERQALLQRRREEMILTARKKMEEKEKERLKNDVATGTGS